MYRRLSFFRCLRRGWMAGFVGMALGGAIPSYAQQFHPAELEAAKTAAHCPYLSHHERELIYYLNLARLNGPAFLNIYVLPDLNLDSLDPIEHRFLLSLIQELSTRRSLQLLHPDRTLTRAAEAHAYDLGIANIFSHSSSDGTSYAERITPYLGSAGITASEALASGYQDGLVTVIQLLIDHGIEDLGHRRTLLDPYLNHIGVAIGPHPKYEFVTVLELADQRLRTYTQATSHSSAD